MNSKLAIIGAVLVVIIAVVVYYITKKESFQHFGIPTDIEDGAYNIISTKGVPLISSAFTPIQCKDFMFRQSKPSADTAWKIQRVAHGVFMFKKPGDKECMYTSPDSSVRSYVINGSCMSKDICGSTKPTETGDLDERSLHTYFMILQNPEGKYYIKSMSNDKYLSMGTNLKMLQEPDENSLFMFQKA